MKFEYELNYDFVKEELSFKVTKQPESLRSTTTERCLFETMVNGVKRKVFSTREPEIGRCTDDMWIRGYNVESDSRINTKHISPSKAADIATLMKKFQEWVEENVDTEVEMTVSEIEKKLGYKIKIVAEDEKK